MFGLLISSTLKCPPPSRVNLVTGSRRCLEEDVQEGRAFLEVDKEWVDVQADLDDPKLKQLFQKLFDDTKAWDFGKI